MVPDDFRTSASKEQQEGARSSADDEARAEDAGDPADGAAAEVSEAQAGLQRQLDEQRDKYLRLAAEFDNFRKRATRERQEIAVRAQGDLIRQLLDSVDDLGRVTAVDASRVDPESIVTGVEAVQKKLLRALSNVGLEVVNPLDQPFNPELHEAVATERALSPEDDHLIAQVYQPGYVLQGQLLRPARVVVKQWSE
ncbi:MAG TPA: nucleotide exchange factor GrpE [Gemmatimonadaceae bacterium]|nr:nucleotide exchange factor GrpE [Gemmatimonadaceae bacterium]